METGAGPHVPTRVEAERSAPPGRDEWRRAIGAVLDGTSPLAAHFQPIAELDGGTLAGYEALARFPAGDIAATPDVWFRVAGELGLGPELEATAVRAALAGRERLPPDTFLTLNVSPHLLTSDALTTALLDEPGDLHRVVVELTEHVEIVDLTGTLDVLARLRAAGASIAIDDAGAGYSGLQQVITLRPQFVKLDRSLVDGIDRDEVKRALAELLGEFAGRIDAWLLAEGVERDGELAALVQLGIPLAQGWLLGRPAPGMAELPEGIPDRIRSLAAARTLGEHVAGLIERVPACPADDPLAVAEAFRPDEVGLVAGLDQHGRPAGLLDRAAWRADAPWTPVSLIVAPASAPEEVLRRAMARPRPSRFAPVVATSRDGRLLGVIPIERLVERVAGRLDSSR
jgi:EAL domain-containing protein (putative c-di-GMP-specific phosphodiesterase class I)